MIERQVDDGHACIAAQAELQDAYQLGVSEVDVHSAAALAQCL